MKLNNKGWGTIEMILLSSGLLIALMVSIYFIYQLFGNFDNAVSNKIYSDLEIKLVDASKKYIQSSSIDKLPIRLSLNDLKNAGYIGDFKDDNGNDCDGYVIISDRVLYNYNAFISCPNFISENY